MVKLPGLHMFVPTYLSFSQILTSVCRICRRSVTKMASTGVYVRCIPNEEKMQMSITYSHNGEPARTYNLDRYQSEECSKAINRLHQNVQKFVTKKIKRKQKKMKLADGCQQQDEVEIPITLCFRGRRMEDFEINKNAWIQGAELEINAVRLPIEVNIPKIIALSLPRSIMSGFPVFPKFDIEFANLDDCSYKWHRCKKIMDASGASQNNSDKYKSEQISVDLVYTPTNEDIGCSLRLESCPKQGDRCGQTAEVTSDSEVSAGPGLCPFEHRQLYTQQECDTRSFRVMSYNILADLYANSDFSRTELFPYCPPYALHIDYRAQLLLKEISGYNADVICLQECDRKVFERDLLLSLNVLGYEGWLKTKGEQTPEGSATFFRKSKFKLVSQHDTNLTEFMRHDPVNLDLWEKVCSKPALKEKMEARTTCIQISILQSADHPDKYLCVANTHFYFHPRADNVRALQVGICIRYIAQVCQPYIEKNISVVFCGDFNSSKCRAVNVLLTTGLIGEDFEDWKSGGDDELIRCNLSHDFKLTSACGYLDYTNYTAGFHGQLDYIFTDTEHLEVAQVIPMPTHEEVTQNIAIPSIVFPSDHIAQICDMQWKNL